MSDIEKVEGGDAPGKRGRLTLKLGDRLKAAPILAKASATGKSSMTVEVRSKKKKVGEVAVDGVTSLSAVDSGVRSKFGGAGPADGLTAQEQLFRLNAINMADSLSAKEQVKVAAQGETVAEPKEEEDVANEEDVVTVESSEDGGAPADSVGVVEDVAPAKPSTKSSHDERNKKHSSSKNRDREKEVGVKKAAAVKSTPKHSKLDIENALSGFDDRCVLRSSSKRRGGGGERNDDRRISREVVIGDGISVRSLAMAMAEKVGDVLRVLRHVGVDAGMHTEIEPGIASEMVIKFGHRPKIVDKVQEVKDLLDVDDDDFDMEGRPPVVTVMGHVDHGKTSLLDALRKSNVVEKEVRGITQHIGAYQISVDDKKITFLDTPGHEAFADMRARGANITDIVVLVVAADDGIMPQTVESINHVKAAGVEMIVAVNKIDKGDADVTRISNDLLQYGVIPESLGGDVVLVPVSARTGENLDKLKSAILLVAEMLELRAPVDCRAQGVVVESKVDRGCGVVATVIVQKGTLRRGDIVVVGDNSYGKVRNMLDDGDRPVSSALPSMPVRVWGLNSVPKAGDSFVVMPSEKHAKNLLARRAEISSERKASNAKGFTGSVLPNMNEQVEEVNLILKADVVGSVEAVCYAIAQIEHEEVKFNILHKEIGDVTKSDVLLAEVSSAVIMAFNVKVDAQARDLVRNKGVSVQHYQVIYDLIDDLKAMVGGRLKPIIQEVQVGLLAVRQVFSSNKSGIVAGCYVSDGSVTRGSIVEVCRGDTVLARGVAKAIRRFKDDVKEVSHGLECGILVEGIKEIIVGDTIRVLEIVEHARGV